MTEYVDDDLPLPKFAEVFGDGLPTTKKAKGTDSGDGGGEETYG